MFEDAKDKEEARVAANADGAGTRMGGSTSGAGVLRVGGGMWGMGMGMLGAVMGMGMVWM